MFVKIVGIVVVVCLFFALLAVLLAFPTMLLWNYVMPHAFPNAGIGQLDFLHALALNFLCMILFKSASTSSSKD